MCNWNYHCKDEDKASNHGTDDESIFTEQAHLSDTNSDSDCTANEDIEDDEFAGAA